MPNFEIVERYVLDMIASELKDLPKIFADNIAKEIKGYKLRKLPKNYSRGFYLGKVLQLSIYR
jgi:hypothetical protein